MKSILKDKIYLSMILGGLFSLILFGICIFVKERASFTVIFILNIIVNFIVTMLSLLFDDKKEIGIRFKLIPLYLMVTLFVLILDVVAISNTLDMAMYSNLMYATNIKLYLGIYSIFVLIMVLLSFYVVLKNKMDTNDTNIRQKSSKQ